MTPFRRSIFALVFASGAVVLLIGILWRGGPAAKPGLAPPISPEARRFPSVAQTRPGGPRGDAAASSAMLDPKAADTVDRIRRMLGSIEPVLPGEVENAPALELLRWWAEIDPVAAIEYAAGHTNVHGRTNLPVELFVSWLDSKSADALNWIKGLKPGELRSQLLPAVISTLAGQRPEDALHVAAELSGENRRTALSALFSDWSAVNVRAAAEQAMRLEDRGDQNFALRLVMGKWMDGDLDAAIAWAKSLPPEPGPDSLDVFPPVTGILMEKWAAHAPADAAAYLLSAPEAAGRIKLLRTVAGQWAGANPNEAIQWSAGVANESDRSVMVRGVLAAVVQTDVQAAADLALTLSTGTIMEEGLSLVIDQWIARDPIGVARWATSLVERPALQATLVPVVTTWAKADISSAGQWVNTLMPGDARDACCVALTQFLAPRQPRLAVQWAETISSPTLRRQQIEALGGAR